jgi:hypothetical protein
MEILFLVIEGKIIAYLGNRAGALSPGGGGVIISREAIGRRRRA